MSFAVSPTMAIDCVPASASAMRSENILFSSSFRIQRGFPPIVLVLAWLFEVRRLVPQAGPIASRPRARSEEHTSELHSLFRFSYFVFCMIKKNNSFFYLLIKKPPKITPPDTLYPFTTHFLSA